MNTKNKEVNYQILFFLGLNLLSTGQIFIATINPAFIFIMASGLGIMVIALGNKDKWSTTTKQK